VYRPGTNRASEATIPACDLLCANGRALIYHGHAPPQHAGGGVWITLSAWSSNDGLALMASLDPLPHLTVKSKPRFLHLSISRADRYPGWDEMLTVVETIAGSDLDMAMIKPRRSDYVSLHNYCFHWWEMPVEWGLQ